MFQSIVINRYKSCKGTILDDLEPGFFVLIGRNAVGKTNILQAIELLAARAAGGGKRNAKYLESPLSSSTKVIIKNYLFSYESTAVAGPPRKRTRTFEELAGSFTEKLSITKLDDKGEFCIEISRDATWLETLCKLEKKEKSEKSRLRIGPALSMLGGVLSFFEPGHSAYEPCKLLNEFFEQVSFYREHEDDSRLGLIDWKSYSQWASQYQSGSEGLGSTVQSLVYLHDHNREIFNEIQDLLGSNGLGLIKTIVVEQFRVSKQPEDDSMDDAPNSSPDFYRVRFSPDSSIAGGGNTMLIDFSSLSEGTRKIINLLVTILMDSKPVYLLEQPEDSLHPHLLHKIIDILIQYSSQSQLIITTHSPDVLDYIDPCQARLVSWNGKATEVRRLTSLEMEAAREYLSEEGSFSDFLESIEE